MRYNSSISEIDDRVLLERLPAEGLEPITLLRAVVFKTTASTEFRHTGLVKKF